MGQVAYGPQSVGARLRLAELIGGLSLAGELVVGFAEGKVLRTALIAVEIARRAGAATTVVQETYYTALIRFLGCTAFAHEEAHRYGAGDDNALRRTMISVDPGQPVQAGRRIIRGIGRGAPLLARAAAVGRLIGDGRAAFQDHTRAQCDASLHLVRTFGVSPAVGSALTAIGERWDGKGVPSRMAGEEIPLALRAFLVADVFELALMEGGLDNAISELGRRAGRHLDPRLAMLAADEAAALNEVAAAEDLWERGLLAEPEPHLVAAPDRLDDVAAAMGRIVDLKSIFMLGHSGGVAATAELLARRLGLAAAEITSLKRAAFLHDLGRIGLSNRIWDKPGPLSRLEREQVELCPISTERILRRSADLAPIAGLAASAGERLDGSGYHRRLPGSAIGLPARILAVADVATALREARPHRPAHSRDAAASILRDEARRGRLDGRVVAALLDGGEPAGPERRLHGLSDREVEVLAWVARGKTNPEVGILLGISAKTVQHHVAHIYEKIGVSSRAGAALFAMENGLLRDPD